MTELMDEIVRRHLWKVIIIILVILALLWLAPRIRASDPAPSIERGKASFYSGAFCGRKTANGEIYNDNSLTAAHRTLPMGTRVEGKNSRNAREATVRINNRGPDVKGRIIDVSTRAARELQMVSAGVVPVEVTVLEPAKPPRKPGSSKVTVVSSR